MKKRRLRKYVIPSIYMAVIALSFFTAATLHKVLSKNDDYNYAKSLMKERVEQTIKEDDNLNNNIAKPYSSDKVEVLTSYYSKDDESDKQEKSLLLYEKTYMPSSGIFYSSNDEFEVLSAADGVIESITSDDILGTVIEVSHNTNLKTFYYSVTDVALNVGDKVKTGTILGHASKNKINSETNNFLFEVYYQGKSIDPEKFYTMNINELQ